MIDDNILPVPRSMSVSENYNYKRLNNAWREGRPYTEVELISYQSKPKKSPLAKEENGFV